ncbi:MAG: maleylpyruvate isomerase family mycothiol-dependent enzyme [Acidimicrobiales bacterium]
MMTVEHQSSWIRTDAERLADIGARSGAASVPACPDWVVADLVSHTGWVHRWMRYMVCLPEGEGPSRETSMAAGLPKVGSAQHPDGDLVVWFREGLDQLLQAFADVSPTKTVSSLFGTHTPSLIIRRMVHETAIHRRDAEDAIGQPSGFDTELAADGIDELLDLWIPMRFPHKDFGATGQTIALAPTDRESAWSITVQPERTVWQRSDVVPAKTDVIARGTASDLYLFVWNRLAVAQLEVSGNADLLARWQAAATV